MVIARIRAGVELLLAGAAALGCAASWSRVSHPVLVAPVADGEPVTTSASYDPQTMLLALALATVAGVLAVVGSARAHRAGHRPAPHSHDRRHGHDRRHSHDRRSDLIP